MWYRKAKITHVALSEEGRGKIDIHGIELWIEYPKGSTRSGVNSQGDEWSRIMKCDYGRIMGTEGADGDAIDAFLGEDLDSQTVFVIDQMDENGDFDEHKCVLACGSLDEAKELYLSNYPKDWKCGPVTEMSVSDFKDWLKQGDTEDPMKT